MEGGFLGEILLAAARFLPKIVAGIAGGSEDCQKYGNGMFLGKRYDTFNIEKSGKGLVIKPVEHTTLRGFYVKHDGNIYKGKVLLKGLFEQLPILNLLF